MLNWANQFNIFCYLDNLHYNFQPHYYECLLAVGVRALISSDTSDVSELDHFLAMQNDWSCGHIAYNLKSSLHGLSNNKPDSLHFPDFFFFVPEVILTINGNELCIEATSPEEVYLQIMQQEEHAIQPHANLNIQQRITRAEYLQTIRKLQQHILRGDCYEINFCQEFYAEKAIIEPLSIYQKLIAVSPTPFSALYRLNDKYLICASPERYIAKEGTKILSQPMKGTAKRNLDDEAEDRRLKEELLASSKERAENVMVVDLVRNDLSKICKGATVKVDELYGIYTFPQVHQMVSTVSGELDGNVPFSAILPATFPMGSMTGAPKYRVMQLIDQYEPSNRGIFSGSVGYIDPNGNFDFNVVIRSIMYNASNQYLSYQVGSGITFYSDAEKEWEECMLKAEAIKRVLGAELTILHG
ncbi:anthranilate synthase component I family protein [Chitinophagaceae bacterium LB-8]|uniref:Anthranilate synthase component I family protein n=1 Tax=Paraflavisolibacter caeni TaxID=2982496 RepID=A0A9X3B6F4_9BACT|nr:anthranilate synthase component I family protein [Paraflavisolibacter caeni]MCU7547955.1 anthranilate synthase component I family protein [Paraflavisolibacter caeni]